MSSNLTKWPAYALDWLTTENSQLTIDPVVTKRVEYAIPAAQGSAWVESLPLNDGIALFHAVHEMKPSPRGQLVHLMDVQLAPTEPIFSAQIWLSGLGCHREYWQGLDGLPIDIIAGPGEDTFRYHSKWDAQILVEGGVCSEMRSVVMPESTLISLLGDDYALDLLHKFGLATGQLTVVHPMPAQVSIHLRNAMNSHVSGTQRHLFAQARLLDYLSGLLDFVSSGKALPKEKKHKQRIQDLHEYLMGLEGRLPTLTELAKEYGLPARRLNQEFRDEFGKPIYSFITEHRLQQAHDLIGSSSIPLKLLADRLGYSHVNHFISAFKKKFGFPPGSLRKK